GVNRGVRRIPLPVSNPFSEFRASRTRLKSTGASSEVKCSTRLVRVETPAAPVPPIFCESLMPSIDSNPLLQTWTTPFGLPPFASIRPEHFEPAFADALRSHRTEIAAIANDESPATFANTLVAFDKAGSVLNRIEK